ncbi:hypothetical protein C8J57DRAFT_1222403 [Mycena rebaudengoi]|nr:hypothetical protein C8J57DRAFT_1222403 [Mycena rebaudengoi]
MAQAKARPGQAKASTFGLAWEFSEPKPGKAGPNPWLSGQAKAKLSLRGGLRSPWRRFAGIGGRLPSHHASFGPLWIWMASIPMWIWIASFPVWAWMASFPMGRGYPSPNRKA